MLELIVLLVSVFCFVFVVSRMEKEEHFSNTQEMTNKQNSKLYCDEEANDVEL